MTPWIHRSFASIRLTSSLVCITFLAGSGGLAMALDSDAQSPDAPKEERVAPELSAEEREFFENRIRPVFVEHCERCHSSAKKRPKGGLEVDTRAALLVGGESGPAIVPGKVDESRLIEAIRYETPDLQMPPKRKLSARQIADLESWVEMGAPDPRTAKPALESSAESEDDADDFDIEKRRAAHWAWQRITKPPVPRVDEGQAFLSDIDRFIRRAVLDAGLEPSPPADPAVWLRRVTFDLTGLPPTPREIDTFLADDAAGARQRVVDRLLASKAFAECWAQHWLDLVRFAETRGHEGDYEIPEAWRYRDYVIRSLDQDVPYDQFVIEHIAGDLLETPRLDPDNRSNQSIQGTGFWFLGEATHSPVDIRGDEAERVHNQLDVFSKAFLGLSVGCARCHDHKFDAISTRDYYALFGYLQSSGYQVADVSDPVLQDELARELAEIDGRSRSHIAQAHAVWRRAQIDKLPAYLLALDEAASITSGEPAEARARIAREHSVDAGVLERIAKLVAEPADRAMHPLQVFGAWLEARAGGDATQRDATLTRLLESWKSRSGRGDQTLAGEVIEDFSDHESAPWLTSGHRFGTRPVEAGELLLDAEGGDGIARIAQSPQAVADVSSEKLTGIYRTRTFEVTRNKLWYRFRGKADVFLAVDSHRMVAGPLHGVVRKKIESLPGEWRWFPHPVTDYRGHRIHVEFSPREDFALERVVLADKKPRDGIRPPSWAEPLVQSARSDDAGAVARAVTEVLRGPLERLRPSKRQALPDADDAALFQWLIRRGSALPEASAAREGLERVTAQYVEQRARVEERIPKPIRALALLDGSPENEPVHVRGNHRMRAEEPVPRAILTALSSVPSPRTDASAAERGSGRLDLALRIASADNPLFARVIVNRVWHHLFARGIVESVDDFGAMGKPPSHPELLDWLASRFIESGWSLKQLIREVVLSATYGQSSRPVEAARDIDPANFLLHRMPIRRRTAESIRDSLLAISGRLDRQHFGPAVRVHITEFMRNHRSPSWSGPLDGDGRRSIYIGMRRNHLPAFLVAFDRPSPFLTMGKRTRSNSPAQPLILLNDPLVHQQAKLWAERLLKEVPEDAMRRLEVAYRMAFGRLPDGYERRAAQAFLEAEAASSGGEDAAVRAWTALCHTLFNVKEFIFVR